MNSWYQLSGCAVPVKSQAAIGPSGQASGPQGMAGQNPEPALVEGGERPASITAVMKLPATVRGNLGRTTGLHPARHTSMTQLSDIA